jgi:hypothetical protein
MGRKLYRLSASHVQRCARLSDIQLFAPGHHGDLLPDFWAIKSWKFSV